MSTLIGILLRLVAPAFASESARIERMIGVTRADSSAALIGVAPGRVEHPPISIMLAPAVIEARAYARPAGTLACTPPSEKESGVALSVAIT